MGLPFFSWRSQQVQVGEKPTWDRIILASKTLGTPHAVGILVKPVPVGNGCEAFHQSKELLFCGHVDRSADNDLPYRKKWTGKTD